MLVARFESVIQVIVANKDIKNSTGIILNNEFASEAKTSVFTFEIHCSEQV